MNKRVSASEANRHFSRILKGVTRGNAVTLTSHGKVVARIEPASDQDEARQQAWTELLAELRNKPAIDIGRWTRDELYDDEHENRD